ncbi:hypothetical protein BCR39DRAFT_522160 [Naematelia encephala]|uniref:Uncharacterized protein n=1 Tax=Naematelia encephala TaxID=71784 RepID=A0A1Y2BDE3_9TREE|nr:hypothetical protein BCR39DRAFT_522160 [Naematelia encephala]
MGWTVLLLCVWNDGPSKPSFERSLCDVIHPQEQSSSNCQNRVIFNLSPSTSAYLQVHYSTSLPCHAQSIKMRFGTSITETIYCRHQLIQTCTGRKATGRLATQGLCKPTEKRWFPDPGRNNQTIHFFKASKASIWK